MSFKVGDRVMDITDLSIGEVTDDKDLHNIFVEFTCGGGGLYCLDPKCEDFDGNILILLSNDI